jgi:hypothetical protein
MFSVAALSDGRPTANPAQDFSVAHTQSRNIRCRTKNGFPIAVTFGRTRPT